MLSLSSSLSYILQPQFTKQPKKIWNNHFPSVSAICLYTKVYKQLARCRNSWQIDVLRHSKYKEKQKIIHALPQEGGEALEQTAVDAPSLGVCEIRLDGALSSVV